MRMPAQALAHATPFQPTNWLVMLIMSLTPGEGMGGNPATVKWPDAFGAQPADIIGALKSAMRRDLTWPNPIPMQTLGSILLARSGNDKLAPWQI
eukprot:9220978-Pyramimonas_sp.AAC.1